MEKNEKQVDIFDDPSCTNCPYCGSRKKIWKKPLVGIALVELIRLYSIYKSNLEPVHISLFSKQRSNFYTLKYWGLIEGSDKVEGKRTAGLWKPTQLGIDFILNKTEVLSHAECLNNQLRKLCGKQINIIKALGKKFDYDELINDSEWQNL